MNTRQARAIRYGIRLARMRAAVERLDAAGARLRLALSHMGASIDYRTEAAARGRLTLAAYERTAVESGP